MDQAPPAQAVGEGSPENTSEPRPQDVVSDVFPPNEVHLIGGSRGVGKSAFEAWLCSHILRGDPFLGHVTHRPPWWGCLILDRGSQDRRYWWERAGLDPDSFPTYCLTEDPGVTPFTLMKQSAIQSFTFLRDRIVSLSPLPGGVLTIDTASFFLGDSRLGYRHSFAHGWALSRLAQEYQLTIFAVVHGGKIKETDKYLRPTDRIIASTGLLGAVGTVAYLSGHAESGGQGYQTLSWEPHHAPAEEFRLTRTRSGLFALAESPEATRYVPRELVTRDHYLPHIPYADTTDFRSTADLVCLFKDLWGFHERTVHRNLAQLHAEGKVQLFHGERGKWQRTAAEPKADPSLPLVDDDDLEE